MNKDFLSQVPASKLKIYDFKAPKRIAKDDLKILNLATDDFSRLMTACISGLTREICSVYNPEITEIKYKRTKEHSEKLSGTQFIKGFKQSEQPQNQKNKNRNSG